MLELYFELDKLYKQQRLLNAEIESNKLKLEQEKLLKQQIDIVHKKEVKNFNQNYKVDNYYISNFEIK